MFMLLCVALIWFGVCVILYVCDTFLELDIPKKKTKIQIQFTLISPPLSWSDYLLESMVCLFTGFIVNAEIQDFYLRGLDVKGSGNLCSCVNFNWEDHLMYMYYRLCLTSGFNRNLAFPEYNIKQHETIGFRQLFNGLSICSRHLLI